jgi:serine/threonine-protein kinase/endoribonuclease IRE1
MSVSSLPLKKLTPTLTPSYRVAIFDVLRKSESQNPPSHPSQAQETFVLLQPRPQLQDVLPTLTSDADLPNLEAAYVGMVPETGSLFAMSPTRFPLVAFGGAERFGYGSGYGSRERLIEAEASEQVGDYDEHILSDVDGITKARKYREKTRNMGMGAGCEDLYSDRRCLVGVRPVDDGDGHESRMKRLLDGPAGRVAGLPLPDAGQGQGQGQLANGSERGVGGVGEDDNAWGRFGVGRVASWWEALAVTIVLGVVSLWFVLRRARARVAKRSGSKKTKALVLPEEGEQEHDVGDVHPQPDFTAGVGVGAGSVSVSGATPDAEPDMPRLPVNNNNNNPLQTPKQLQPQPNGHGHGIGHGMGNGGKPLPLLPADDGDESEGEGDAPVTPGKRKARRGKRGKKKKTGTGTGVGVGLHGGEEGGEGEDGVGSGSGSGSGGNGGTNGAPAAEETPSLVVNSPRLPVPATPSLIVSDTILGE